MTKTAWFRHSLSALIREVSGRLPWGCLPRVVDLSVQLMSGGMEILTDKPCGPGRTKPVARTVIQLDGDVITAWDRESLDHGDLEELAKDHLAAVRSAIKPLRQLVFFLTRVRWGLAVLGTAGTVLSGRAVAQSVQLFPVLCLCVSFVVLMSGLMLRRIFVAFVRRRVRRLWQEVGQQGPAFVKYE